MTDPTAAHPLTVTLCWTPDQNHGRVSVYPTRAPLESVLSLLYAGESHDDIALEYGLGREQVQVLAKLAGEALEW